MFKALGKVKSVKEKSHREKSVRHDDGLSMPKNKMNKEKDRDKHDEKERHNERERHTHTHIITHNDKERHTERERHAHAEREKEKEKHPRSRKKKKGHGAGSTEDISQSSDDIPSRGNSHSTNGRHSHTHHRTKAKKNVSKLCEEAVDASVKDFFDCAWTACAERFFIASAPVTVSFELRNTWLRIVEAEWQDLDMREKPPAKANRIFKRDEPPLPLAFDSWSRGAIESLPGHRRESVMDPFLRDLSTYGKAKDFDRLAAIPGSYNLECCEWDDLEPKSRESGTFGAVEESPVEHESDINTVGVEDALPSDDIPEKDRWNFDLDEKLSPAFLGESEINSVTTSPQASKSPEESQLSSGSVYERVSFDTVLSARLLSSKESTTERDSTPHSSGKSGKSATRKSIRLAYPTNDVLKKRFSPSQCGGRGSGVLRLPAQIKSEALPRMKTSIGYVKKQGVQIMERNVWDRVDIVQLSKRSEPAQNLNESKLEEDDELEVHPLFEERTQRAAEDTHHTHFQVQEPLSRRRPSYNDVHNNGLEEVASDINNRFLKRKMANLHGRFKRQAVRSLAARAKQKAAAIAQAQLQARRVSSPTSGLSTSISSISGSNKLNQTKKGADGRRSTITKRSSQSVTNINAARVGSTAKNTVSYPQLVGSRYDDTEQAGDMMPLYKRNDFKKMGNVRSSHRNIASHGNVASHRHIGRFENPKGFSTELQSRLESGRHFRGWNQGKEVRTGQCLQTTPSDCLTRRSCCSIISPP